MIYTTINLEIDNIKLRSLTIYIYIYYCIYFFNLYYKYCTSTITIGRIK